MANSAASIIDGMRAEAPSLRLYEQSDPEYAELRRVYNGALPHKPLVIARPHSEGEVSNALKFCSDKSVPVTARSGGHDFFGRSLTDGVVLDMRSMGNVTVSRDRATACVGGGVIGGALQEELDRQGLFTPTGQTKSVGYVSWACGGGYGFYTGLYGLGVDQIVGAKVVISSGDVVDTDHDPELLWALRGAGAGTVGVVVELRVKVYPIPTLYAGILAFPLSEAETVLGRFEQLFAQCEIPDECSGDCLVANPAMLGLEGSQPCYAFYFCWAARDGNTGPAKALLQKMVKLGTVVGNTISETKPAQFGGGDSSSPTFMRSRNIRSLNRSIGAILARNPLRQPYSTVVIHNIHGTGAKQDFTDGIGGIFPNRFGHVILGFHGGTHQAPGADQDALVQTTAWALGLEKEIDASREALEGGFPSFYSPEAIDPVEFFGAEAAGRLRMLKERLDRQRIFRSGMQSL